MTEANIIRSKHRARKEYECCECKAKIFVGETYVLHQEQQNRSYWHKTKYCTKCMTVDAVKLKHTRNVKPNRPCASEVWIVADKVEGKREVVKLGENYYKEKDYQIIGSDITFHNDANKPHGYPIEFIRKVYVDD